MNYNRKNIPYGVSAIFMVQDGNDVIQAISLLDADRIQHFLTDEANILANMHKYIMQSGVVSTGMTTTGIKMFLGWDVYARIWPVIVSKMFALGLNLPPDYKSNLDSRFNTNKHLIELSNIATQGMVGSYSGIDKPDLRSALLSWPIPNSLKSGLVKIDQISVQLNDDSVTALNAIECYLDGMMAAYMKYTSHEALINE